jgi:uncharacterized OsmC-like protein
MREGFGMTEKVMLRQNNHFETEYHATDPENEQDDVFHEVSGLHELTPYGMLLAALAGCTAIVVNTFASNHDIPLETVEITVAYQRNFKEDCINCETIDRYEDVFHEEISFEGQLTQEQIEKLFEISHKCPIQRMLEDGVVVNSVLMQ